MRQSYKIQRHNTNTSLPSARMWHNRQSLNEKKTQEFKDFLEERTKSGMPASTIFDYILHEQEINPKRSMTIEDFSHIKRRMERVSLRIESPCVVMLKDQLLTVSQKHMALIQLETSEPEKPVYEQHIRDIENRRHQIQRYMSETKLDCYYSINQFIARDKELETQNIKEMRLVATHVWNLNFDKAEAACDFIKAKPQLSLEIAILRPILKGFSNLQQLIRSDPQLIPIFYKRKTHEIPSPSSSALNLLFDQKEPYQNLIHTIIDNSFIKQFKQLSLNKKIFMVKSQMQFLISTSKKYMQSYQKSQFDAYFKGIIIFLGNSIDRRTKMFKQIVNINGIWVVDQYLLAQRFFTGEAMKEFMEIFKERIMKTSNLINIALCSETEEKRTILQNYLDNTNDLETVAALSLYEKRFDDNDHNPFDNFIHTFKEVIRMEGSTRKLEQFQSRQVRSQSRHRSTAMVETEMYEALEFPTKMPEKPPFFLRLIDFQNKSKDFNDVEILRPPPIRMQDILCAICTLKIRSTEGIASLSRKQQNDDMYIECLKCHHGGHSRHVLSWFEKNQRCPKSDCTCICN